MLLMQASNSPPPPDQLDQVVIMANNLNSSAAAVDAWHKASIVCVVEDMNANFRGLWFGDNPFAFMFPTVVAKIILVTLISRSFHLLLRPLKQPRFVCYVLGGIVMGPSFLGRNEKMWKNLFPPRENELLQTLAIVGGIYFVFIIGVKMDNSMIVRSAKNSWRIGFLGYISAVFVATALLFALVGKFSGVVLLGPFVLYIPLSLSYTFFPVLAHALEELNLLNSEIGQLAMSAAVLNDLMYWFFLALSIGLKQEKMSHSLQGVSAFIILVVFSFTILKRLIMRVIRQTPEGRPVSEAHTVAILMGVLVMAFISSTIGATYILGPMLFGFIIPGGPPLGSALVRKTEAVVSEFLMPLFFIQVGYSTDIRSINNWPIFIKFEIVIFMAYVAKFVGTMLASLACKIRFKTAVLLGLIMNIKGILELIHYHRWKSSRYLDDQTYTQLVLSTTGVTMIVTPLISLLSRREASLEPSSRLRGNLRGLRSLRSIGRNAEFRVLCCIHSEENVHGMITLLEASNPSSCSPICAYVVQTSELIGLAAPLMVPYDKRRRKMKLAFSTGTEQVVRAFENYSKNSRGPVVIMPFIMVSSYRTMHETLCRFSQDKFIPLLLLPFHKNHRYLGSGIAASLQQLNANMQANAPCTVGILVDSGTSGGGNGFGGNKKTVGMFSQHIGVVFVGGQDDREALAYASRMSDDQSEVNVTVFRLLMTPAAGQDAEVETALDDAAAEEFRLRNSGNAAAAWREIEVGDAAGAMNAVRELDGRFDLVMVGRRRSCCWAEEDTMLEFVENEELGVIGDMLASDDFCGGTVSVLVVQHHIRDSVGIKIPRTGSSKSAASSSLTH